MTKLHELAQLGQSVWCDYIRRSFITSGQLQALIDQGLRGLTSNPSIFEKAIAGSADYDAQLRQLATGRLTVEEMYEILALNDIETAADMFRPVFEATEGVDGYVSLEVSPQLADNTVRTVAEAKRLFSTLRRPNIMIKVPVTHAGILAIEHLIGSGVNVNATLLFGVENYRAVAEAYMKGLEMLATEGPGVPGGRRIDQVASVASFFVSRVDSAVDPQLGAEGGAHLQGKIAIANAKCAYAEFRKIFSGARWEGLKHKGARIQRLLWGSTGTKNPLYPDTLYVDELIGPDTVNTLPPAVIHGFMDHGRVDETLTRGLETALEQLAELKSFGIDLESVTRKLQEDGVKQFAEPFDAMMAHIHEKQEQLVAGRKTFAADLGADQTAVDQALIALRDAKTVQRIWLKDAAVWTGDPSGITNRLGWLNSPKWMLTVADEITAFADQVRREGFMHVLLLGMGGSSLAPEMFRNIFGVQSGFPDLLVLDSTDPGAVIACEKAIDLERTLFVVSTKSGGTVETLSLMKYFYNRVKETTGAEAAGKQFAAVTDPGSSLQETARRLNFRKTFLNDPDIGGRYSALSYFGLVPAALIGMDLDRFLEQAAIMACNCEGCNCPVGGDNTGAWLGAIMGTLAVRGRDKLTLVLSPSIRSFGDWVEQLIAESTGKNGKGILPVSGEALAPAECYSRDRLFVYLRLEEEPAFDSELDRLVQSGHPVVRLNLKERYDLGGEIFRWEMAVSVAAGILKINPFDQPNVESAKVQARRMVEDYKSQGKLPQLPLTFEEGGIQVFTEEPATTLSDALKTFMANADAGEDETKGRSYIAVQAYVTPTPETDTAFQEFRTRLMHKFRMAVTFGYGPRFLHSTGQLHKGDAGCGLFIQVTSDMPQDVPIPDEAGESTSSISFGVLKTAQALGDRRALLDAGRRVIRFHLKGNVPAGVNGLQAALE